MPESTPSPRKMTCVVREYSRILSMRPAPTVLPVMMPTALEKPFIAMYIMLWSMPVMLVAAMTPASNRPRIIVCPIMLTDQTICPPTIGIP